MKNTPKLLRDKEFRILQSAFDHQKEYSITMTLQNYTLTVSVTPATPTWNQPMLFQVKQSRNLIDETKNCRSLSELQSYLGYI